MFEQNICRIFGKRLPKIVPKCLADKGYHFGKYLANIWQFVAKLAVPGGLLVNAHQVTWICHIYIYIYI